ncbi:MAG: hypothetical protein V2A53_09890 [bacterium]
MEDIDRFRIACNYLSDIFEMVENLKQNRAFGSAAKVPELPILNCRL